MVNANPAFDEGDAYDQELYRQRRSQGPQVLAWVWIAPLVLLVGGMAYWYFTRGGDSAPPVMEHVSGLFPQWNPTPYTPGPVRASVAEPDAHDELLRRLLANDEELRRELAALKAARHPTTQAPAGEKPKPRPHRDMGHTNYKLPADIAQTDPTYRLAPWATMIPCQTYTRANSDTGEFMTAKVTKTVYDTETGRIPLIPQNSTIGVQYNGADLLYGNERLPTVALELTLPNGEVVSLGESPVTDAEGVAGLVSRVNQHFWRLAGAVLIQGVLGRGVPAAIQQATSGADVAVQISSGVAQTGGQAVTYRTQPALNTRPTIEVFAGEQCHVLLTKPLELRAAY